ncbi:putative signal recognition particle receptor subunit alpha-like [Penaeus vannamei]|uniref:Putative signal recognition particle receptor subunit alpha-like n=1 Tax=Penaeus vannamei TaxID=6689 RepID=A0A3R7QRC5_PENVA|nr:putative signal recognition particle receptor subunit alpha-like [Penaeus vannamei]
MKKQFARTLKNLQIRNEVLRKPLRLKRQRVQSLLKRAKKIVCGTYQDVIPRASITHPGMIREQELSHPCALISFRTNLRLEHCPETLGEWMFKTKRNPMIKNLVVEVYSPCSVAWWAAKTLSEADIEPVLEKLKDHLIGKNVASEIATKLCQSVGKKLEGKVVGTFEGVSTTVRNTLTESLVQLLTPKRRLDVLRDVVEAKTSGRPYTMAFCGVNGVGKSTNLAKISFWLIENNFRVLIAACDTFRAGAVEQLRTHMHHLNALHPPENHKGRTMVQLYEQGYGKDAAEIARHAIEFARKNDFDVVLIDTAGRMQDNEPLMRALAKLILVNEPDLTLFVGEALVGNEAVDQLVKFNRALANHSTSNKPQVIDGIVLTKFDTIDDKVGAAISMTYITGQPIVFVGCGQTYTDLRRLDAKAVVNSLMK